MGLKETWAAEPVEVLRTIPKCARRGCGYDDVLPGNSFCEEHATTWGYRMHSNRFGMTGRRGFRTQRDATLAVQSILRKMARAKRRCYDQIDICSPRYSKHRGESLVKTVGSTLAFRGEREDF